MYSWLAKDKGILTHTVFSPGTNEDRVCGRGLGGVCDHVNHFVTTVN